jgi:hypothetical protein
MADRLQFPTAELLKFSRKKEGGTAQFSSSITKAVMQTMEWTEIPDCATGCTLDGELAASNLTLTPKDEALKRFACDLDVNLVNSFVTVRRELEGKQGKGHRTELRFIAHFQDIEGARKLEEFLMTANKCSVTISYQKQAKQVYLPGVEASAQEELPVQ